MKIMKWAAVAVTALFVLMNLGAVPDSSIDAPYRVVASVLAILGAGAAIGLATNRPWGRLAVVGVGALNVITAITGVFTDQQGVAIGVVVGALGVLLGGLTAPDHQHAVVG